MQSRAAVGDRWERLSATPLTALSLAFLVVYAVPILLPDISAGWRHLCATLNVVIWLLFGADYVVRVVRTDDRLRYIRSHWFELAVLILPVLRPLRALRLIMAVKILNRSAETFTRGRLAVYVTATTVLLVFVAALAVLDAERGRSGSSIETFPEALWWAVVTVTTVGYGDYFPVTLEGRLVALAMMVGGIGLLGFVTGSLASWIVERISTEDQKTEATREDVAGLLQEVRDLRLEFAQFRAAAGETGSAPAPEADDARRSPSG
jgi:voltage-gated potassium channel